MTSSLTNAHVIIVDDETINLTIMELSLQEKDCKVTTFTSGEKCLESLEGYNLSNYDCLVTDHSMSGMTGIELMDRIKELDPTLEVIVVTGQNERKIIQESLRKGAYDFLDKPLDLQKFYDAVERAIVATSVRRKRDATEASLLAARSTGLFNSIQTEDWKTNVELIYRPKHELGGDFIEVFETSQKQKIALIGDISGHDIQSALLSSHFLGALEGRRAVESQLDTKALSSAYNQLLVSRRENSEETSGLSMGSSLSLCAIELTEDEESMTISNCGIPPIYIVHKDQSVSRIRPENHPLGWFEELEVVEQTFKTSDILSIHGYTDGLIEYAMNHQWDVLALLFHLNSLNKSDQQEFLFNAEDDILLANLEFGPQPKQSSPIIYEEYRGNEAHKIDRFQVIWLQSLKLAAPSADPKVLERFVLAAREAVLNGVNHGCMKDPRKVAKFLVKIDLRSKEIEGIVTDPGDGHEFDHIERDNNLLEMRPGNLGLVLISKLVDEMTMENSGSTLRMKMKI